LKAIAKRKLSPFLKTLAVKQLLKWKYHATHLGVFNDRQSTTINGLLNKATRQAIGLIPNYPIERFKDHLNKLDLASYLSETEPAA